MLAASLAMPTYADRGTVLTAPAIFPGFIAVVLLLLGALLALRTVRRPAPASSADGLAWRPMLTGLGLMTVTIALIGHIDFRLLLAGFCVAFAALFVSWRGPREEIVRRAAAFALVILVVAVLVPMTFQHVFLIRLP
nr:tripartite tricarboxylate transporter TctB family protein [Flavimaribacter sediminis]